MLAKHHSPGFLAVVDDAKSRVQQIEIGQYKRMLEAGEPHILIDVREESEWAAGHAAHAIHLGKGIIERDIEVRIPDKEARLILYCGGGYRSALASDAIQRMGYTNVISLDGGWRAIEPSGIPLDRQLPPAAQDS